MFQHEQNEDICVLTLKDLSLSDTQLAASLRSELRQLFQQGHYRIIVDLAGWSTASSALLSVLVAAHSMAAKYRGQILLCNVAPAFTEVVQVTNIDKHLKIFPSRSKALEEMRNFP